MTEKKKALATMDYIEWWSHTTYDDEDTFEPEPILMKTCGATWRKHDDFLVQTVIDKDDAAVLSFVIPIGCIRRHLTFNLPSEEL